MTRVHALKTWPQYHRDVREGRKTFEVRKNDRDYQVGDLLVLMAYDGELQMYGDTDPEVRRVTYVLPGGQFGIELGHVVLGLGEP